MKLMLRSLSTSAFMVIGSMCLPNELDIQINASLVSDDIQIDVKYTAIKLGEYLWVLTEECDKGCPYRRLKESANLHLPIRVVFMQTNQFEIFYWLSLRYS